MLVRRRFLRVPLHPLRLSIGEYPIDPAPDIAVKLWAFSRTARGADDLLLSVSFYTLRWDQKFRMRVGAGSCVLSRRLWGCCNWENDPRGDVVGCHQPRPIARPPSCRASSLHISPPSARHSAFATRISHLSRPPTRHSSFEGETK
jgi:hypothetical protein